MSASAEPLRIKSPCGQRVRRTRYASYRPCRHACHEQGCGYTCATRFQLIRHSRFHTGERPYVCQVPGCHYATAESTHLPRHMLTHRAQPKRVSFMEPLSLTAPVIADGLQLLALAASRL